MKFFLLCALLFSFPAFANLVPVKSGPPPGKANLDDQTITDAMLLPDKPPLIRALYFAARNGNFRADQKGPLVLALRNVLAVGTAHQPRLLAALALNGLGAGGAEVDPALEAGLRACFPLRYGHYRNFSDEWAQAVAKIRSPSEGVVRHVADIAMRATFPQGQAAARGMLERWAGIEPIVRTWALQQQPRVFDPAPAQPDTTPCVVLMAVEGELLDEL